MKREIHWRQVWAEVGLLFLGAGLAFLGDSLWDQRQERLEEAEYVASLRTDFGTNALALDGLEEFYESVLVADSAVLAYARYGEWAESPDSLLALTTRAFTMEYFRPALGTYNDMVGSGKLQLLRNAQLRASLAGFVEEVEIPRSDELANLMALRMVLVRDVLMVSGWVRTRIEAVQAELD